MLGREDEIRTVWLTDGRNPPFAWGWSKGGKGKDDLKIIKGGGPEGDCKRRLKQFRRKFTSSPGEYFAPRNHRGKRWEERWGGGRQERVAKERTNAFRNLPGRSCPFKVVKVSWPKERGMVREGMEEKQGKGMESRITGNDGIGGNLPRTRGSRSEEQEGKTPCADTQ